MGDPRELAEATEVLLSNQGKEDGLLSRLNQYLFDVSRPIEIPEPVLAIAKSIIATNRNIICFMGQSKSGKSGVIGGILSGIMRTAGMIIETIGIEVKANEDGKYVLHVDTEQADWNHDVFNRNILKKAGRERSPEWFHSIRLRQFSPKEKIQAVELLLSEYSKRFDGVFAIVIDGIADFCTSVNDEKEVNAVVSFFERMAIKYNCPVITILHTNPGNAEKGRGHLGSQLERKCESVLSITKDQETGISTIEGKLLRNAGNIPKIQFEYDIEKGYHVSRGIVAPVNKKAERKKEYEEIGYQIFEGGKLKYTHSELCEQIQDARSVGKPQAKKDISFMTKECLITKPLGSKYYQLVTNIKN